MKVEEMLTQCFIILTKVGMLEFGKSIILIGLNAVEAKHLVELMQIWLVLKKFMLGVAVHGNFGQCAKNVGAVVVNEIKTHQLFEINVINLR